MKRIVVTPAGRRRYLTLLAGHLAAQRDDFDEWHLWLNTLDADDIEWCKAFCEATPWAKLVEAPDSAPGEGNYNIHRFFPGAASPDAVYVRLDDDVVWLQPGFLEELFSYRIQHPEPFLVYAHIVNNGITSHLHHRAGLVDFSGGTAGYDCVDSVGWGSPEFARALHEAFLADLAADNFQKWRVHAWKLWHYERCSINAISWLGADFAEFGGRVGQDEEPWLSVDKPRSLNRPNVIWGGATCVHFAFHTQRDLLDATDLLQRYEALVPSSSSPPQTPQGAAIAPAEEAPPQAPKKGRPKKKTV